MKNEANRKRRKIRIRKKLSGTAERPRLSIFRSTKHMYVQVVDDVSGRTLASASTQSKDVSFEGAKTEGAKAVGTAVAKKLLDQGISQVVFDRNGFLYHGRVRALADAAREAGLKF